VPGRSRRHALRERRLARRRSVGVGQFEFFHDISICTATPSAPDHANFAKLYQKRANRTSTVQTTRVIG
jgi:hypothetical protein